MSSRLGQAARNPRSPWVGIDPNVDPLKWAAVLRRAHRLAVDQGSAPAVLRHVVASSWERAASQGVDPDGYAPVALDAEATRQALARNPISHLLSEIERILREATLDSRYLVALSDPTGVLLWVDGHTEALNVAGEAGFEPGHLCSEQAVGTNAVGTAIELRHPVQIFSAEHFSRRLHGLTCSAAPIRDPETDRPVAVLNISGDFRTCHPHSLPLISSVSRLLEERLARELSDRDNRLRAVFIDRLGAEGKGRSALVSKSGRVVAAYPKNWLGPRLQIGEDGNLRLPTGVEIEPLGGSNGAMMVRGTSSRARAPRSALTIEALPPRRVRVGREDWHVDLSPRHSEIIMMLALNPDGLSNEELRALLYEAGAKSVTVRAEISRLRKLLGPILLSNPYRLEQPVEADLAALREMLHTPR
jgi:hypothetical protein